KNDLTQIVNAVNAFYTEYGKYPIDPAWGCSTTDVCFSWNIPGAPQCGPYNDKLLNELRACNAAIDSTCSANAVVNTRKIVYISPPTVKDPSHPRSGIATIAGNAPQGTYYDPFGSPYNVEIDTDYDNSVPNPYVALGGSGAGPTLVMQGL